jgi:hypothetical protein
VFMQMRVEFLQQEGGQLWRLFVCCVKCEGMVVIRQKEAKETRGGVRKKDKKDIWATGGREEEFSNRVVGTVCGHCERSQERRMKGMGFLEISVGMIAGWARFEAVEKFCGKKVKIVGRIVERAAVFRNWGKGEVVEGVKDGEGGIEVVSEVEIGFISEN